MALGSVFGALATMFTAVSRRSVEIATPPRTRFPPCAGRRLGPGRGDGARACRRDSWALPSCTQFLTATPHRRSTPAAGSQLAFAFRVDAGVDRSRPGVVRRRSASSAVWRRRCAPARLPHHNRSAGNLSVPARVNREDAMVAAALDELKIDRSGNGRSPRRPGSSGSFSSLPSWAAGASRAGAGGKRPGSPPCGPRRYGRRCRPTASRRCWMLPAT